MAVRPIAMIGDPVLRSRAVEVTEEELGDPATQQVIDDMIDTMRHANGAGIAANQVSVPKRIAVVEVGENPRYPYKPRIPLTVLINPVLEVVGDETVVINEGCLSVPLRGDVTRYVHIRLRYLGRDGEAHEDLLHGLTAATMQHECDHLDGRLFVDRLTDPRTLSTWEEFELHHRDAFVARITEFVDRVGS